MAAYAYKTTDLGKTWKNIIPANDVNGFVRNIQEDYVNPNLLFLGTEFGLYITINGGNSWAKFSKNMPSVAVHFIDMHKETNDLVMGTHGRGVIIIDDISPLREIKSETLSSKLHFFSEDSYIMNDYSGFSDNFGRETQFVGENPSFDCQIKYLLPKRHTFGKMTFEIQDMNGNLLSKLGAGKSKGINIVNWNYTIKQPKIAKGKTFSFGGFTSPRVAAGTYKAIIKKGRDTYEKEFDVVYDQNTGLNSDERKMQYKVVMKMYNMVQDLAYLVYKLDAIVKDEKTSKKTASKLNELKETLVITTGDNYVGMAKRQLREKMADLYSKIASSYDKPSENELNNLSLIEDEFNRAKTKFNKLKKKVKIEDLSLKSFDEFISE